MWQHRERMLSPRAWLFDSQAGSTLIDVIIAVAIFGVAAPALLTALSMLVRAEERSREQILLVNLAQNQLESAKQRTYQEIATPYPTVTPPEGYTVVASSSIPILPSGAIAYNYAGGGFALWDRPTGGKTLQAPTVLAGC